MFDLSKWPHFIWVLALFFSASVSGQGERPRLPHLIDRPSCDDLENANGLRRVTSWLEGLVNGANAFTGDSVAVRWSGEARTGENWPDPESLLRRFRFNCAEKTRAFWFNGLEAYLQVRDNRTVEQRVARIDENLKSLTEWEKHPAQDSPAFRHAQGNIARTNCLILQFQPQDRFSDILLWLDGFFTSAVTVSPLSRFQTDHAEINVSRALSDITTTCEPGETLYDLAINYVERGLNKKADGYGDAIKLQKQNLHKIKKLLSQPLIELAEESKNFSGQLGFQHRIFAARLNHLFKAVDTGGTQTDISEFGAVAKRLLDYSNPKNDWATRLLANRSEQIEEMMKTGIAALTIDPLIERNSLVALEVSTDVADLDRRMKPWLEACKNPLLTPPLKEGLRVRVKEMYRRHMLWILSKHQMQTVDVKTEEGAGPDFALSLIGIFFRANQPQVLFRFSYQLGKMFSVSTGDRNDPNAMLARLVMPIAIPRSRHIVRELLLAKNPAHPELALDGKSDVKAMLDSVDIDPAQPDKAYVRITTVSGEPVSFELIREAATLIPLNNKEVTSLSASLEHTPYNTKQGLLLIARKYNQPGRPVKIVVGEN